MSSSTVLSPHTPALELANGPSSSLRSRRVTRGAKAGAGWSSPVPTNASSSTTHSTRSRTRQSGSPEKRQQLENSRRSAYITSSQPGSDTSNNSNKIADAVKDEEGESEIEVDADALGSQSQESAEDEAHDPSKDDGASRSSDALDNGSAVEAEPASRNSSAEKESGTGAKSVIRLTIGRKRKVEETVEPVDDGNESDLTPELEDRDAWLGPAETIRGERAELNEEDAAEAEEEEKGDVASAGVDELGDGLDEKMMEGEAGNNMPKRAPRKKRKWLKKGEGRLVRITDSTYVTNSVLVDPDDPIAVAKQKERHALIDE